MNTNSESLLGILDNLLDGDFGDSKIKSLRANDFEEFADRLDHFYEDHSLLVHEADSFYSGGWAAGNWLAGEGRQYLYTSCLYYPSVIVHDPLAEWFYLHKNRLVSPGPLRSSLGRMEFHTGEVDLLSGYFDNKSDLERVRAEFKTKLTAIAELRPLIEAGIVRLVSPWHIVRNHQEQIMTAVRHDMRNKELFDFISSNVDSLPRSDRIRGMMMTPDDGWHNGDIMKAMIKDPAYFYNKTIAIAASVNAKYIPPETADAALLRLKLNNLQKKLSDSDIELKIAPGLVSAELPFFSDLDAETLVSIRNNERAFEDWRRELRTIFRNVHLSTSDYHFEMEASQVISDALVPVAHQVEDAMSSSSYLRRVAGENLLAMTAGVVGVLGAQHLMQTSDPAAVPGVIGTGAFARLYRSIFGRPSPGQLSGSQAVIGTLTRKR